MENLSICTVQTDIVWENPIANQVYLEELIQFDEAVDLIVLPEMFTTGFTINPAKIAEHHDEKMDSFVWMKKMAQSKNAVMTGSIVVEDQGKYYNRLYWVKPSGEYSYYDKHNLFAFAGEDKEYCAGNTRLIEDIKGWKIMPLICFDLRFPSWARNKIDNDGKPTYDLLLYVANWPAKRRIHWQKLLEARAIENQCYVAGINRVGEDPNGLKYIGDTTVIDFFGEEIIKHNDGQSSILITRLEKTKLDAYRKSFPILLMEK